MNIVMITNTFTPHVGGVAQSVSRFTRGYRKRGHRVLVVSPTFPRQPPEEEEVIRVAAIQRFNGSDFSVTLPTLFQENSWLSGFRPDVIHSHHPYLLGDAALRLSAAYRIPLVFTHHTRYEKYTHYVPAGFPALERFVIELSTGYANLCRRVVAPSESIRALLESRGVKTAIRVIPTGVELERWKRGDRWRGRARLGLPPRGGARGVGRLAPEARSVARFLAAEPSTRFLVVGEGPSREAMEAILSEADVSSQVRFAGCLEDEDLVDAYHAMDSFAFASQTETQGMVLVEAMASGLPVVAVDATGVREVVQDRVNGRLLAVEDEDAFAGALGWVKRRRGDPHLEREIQRTAQAFSMDRSVDEALDLYEDVRQSVEEASPLRTSGWETFRRTLEEQWKIWANRVSAVAGALVGAASRAGKED